jgi:hypothetical protein
MELRSRISMELPLPPPLPKLCRLTGSGSSDAPSLVKRCAARSGHQGPVLAVLAMLAAEKRLRVAPRDCALPLTAAACGAL